MSDTGIDSQAFKARLAELPRDRTHVLPALLLAQDSFSWVSDHDVRAIARHLRMTPNDVEAVATSYPEVRRRSPGRVVIRVCDGASCIVNQGTEVLSVLENHLGIRANESTSDGEFSLELTPCCFACGMAPVIEVNGTLSGRMTPALALQLLLTGKVSDDER